MQTPSNYTLDDIIDTSAKCVHNVILRLLINKISSLMCGETANVGVNENGEDTKTVLGGLLERIKQIPPTPEEITLKLSFGDEASTDTTNYNIIIMFCLVSPHYTLDVQLPPPINKQDVIHYCSVALEILLQYFEYFKTTHKDLFNDLENYCGELVLKVAPNDGTVFYFDPDDNKRIGLVVNVDRIN